MKSLFGSLAVVVLAFHLSACLTSPSSSSGGLAAVTIENTNVNAIIGAAQEVFSADGYTLGPVNYPSSISFDKPAGGFGQVMWGSYGETTSYRARLDMVPLGGGSYRVSAHAGVVNDAGQAGFESGRPMMGPWSAEFIPLLKKIQAQAGGVGPGY